MGHWSESCAFSGMRIKADEKVYVVQLGDRVKQYESRAPYSFLSPLMKGKYDEYGGVELTESIDLPDLTYEVGDVIDTRENGWVIVHAGILECLETLPMDFPYVYDTDPETSRTTSLKIESGLLGDWANATARVARKNYESRSDVWNIDGIENPSEALVQAMKMVNQMQAKEHLSGDSVIHGAADLHSGCETDEQRDTFWKLWRRNLILRAAEAEVRRQVSPPVWGPQDGGDRATMHLANAILEYSKKNIWGDES